MALSLADVNLIVPSRVEYNRLQEYIAAKIPQNLSCPWLARSWPGTDLTGVAFPTGFMVPSVPRINVFRWPWSASRWAHGWFLASSNQVDEIQAKAFPPQGEAQDGVAASPGIPVAVNLYMDSPGIRSVENVTTPVYIIAINPLARIDVPPNGTGLPPTGDGNPPTFINGLYLITVVDARWFWWGVPSPVFSFSASTTWASIIGQCADLVKKGNTFGSDPVSGNYFSPSPSWQNTIYEPFPIVFDALLYNCGLRLVRALNGDLYAENTTTAAQDLDDDDANNPDRSIRAGGGRFNPLL